MERLVPRRQLVLYLLPGVVDLLLLALRLRPLVKGEAVVLLRRRLLQGHSLCVNLLVLALV